MVAYCRDRRPLLEGCECAACSGRHSRAYIHHLLLAHEILGEVGGGGKWFAKCELVY